VKLKVGNQYIIPFKGLKEGQHNFDFELGDAFFEENHALEITHGKIVVQILLIKKSNFLELDVMMKGTVKIQCDRCIEYFNFPLEYRGKLLVKFKEETEEPDDQIMFLHPNIDILDLNQYFYDCIGLNLPLQKFHPEKENGKPGCNPEVLKLLDSYSHSKTDNKIDPRWSKLNELLKDKNK
jgi:uncharacterized metal-binding protein YceD (DUF177 family)